jgi:replicative DNA helicase
VTVELHDFAAERQFLGAVWASHGRTLDETTITASDIVHEPHRALYDAMQTMRRDGVPFDAAGIAHTIGVDKIKPVEQALMEVITSGAVPQSAGWHANVLQKLTAHRRLLEAATRLQQYVDGQRDIDDLTEMARAEVDRALAVQTHGDLDDWATHLDRAFDRWQTQITDAVPTGWHELDELLSGGGLRPEHLTVVGARPGVGKSLVATMLAGHAAAARDGAVYFASVEMSEAELTDRIAAAKAGVNLRDLTNRSLTDDDVNKLRVALAKMRDWPLVIDDRVRTIADIRRGARTAMRRHGKLRLILVDYVQILEGIKTDAKTSRQEIVSELSRTLKLMSKEYKAPVVMLAQLNRGGAQRQDKQPILTDLRESGSLEQDGDEVILLHRDDNEAELAGMIRLILAKNRHGPTGVVDLVWQPWISRIVNPRIGAVA